MQTVQLTIADAVYAATVREALSRNCAWHVESVDRPDLSQPHVLVLDELAFARLALPLSNPERVVLITRKDPQLMSQAWEAGIVSVVSMEDSISTVLLAIMAAGLRIPHTQAANAGPGEICPTATPIPASIPPESRTTNTKRCKIQ